MRRLVSVALGWLVAFAAVAAASRAAAAAVPPGRVAPDTARDSLKAFRAQNESPDSEPEPVLVELQVGRAASRTVSAYRVGAEALLPVTTLLQLGEAGYRLSLDGRLEATVNPGGRRLLIDVHRDTMSLGARRVEIEPAYRFFHDNELYVGARRLGELLESRILVDWGELSVTLVDDGKLPIGWRLRREAARAAFLQRTRGVQPERALALERPRWDGLVVDYSFLAAGEQPLGGGAYSVGLGADALGGSLELGVQSVGTTGDAHARGSGSWTGVWRDRQWVKQLRLGDGFTTGPRLRSQRGLLVTNAPYLRPSLRGAVHGADLPRHRQPRFALRDHGALDGAGRRGAVLARQPREPHPSLYGDGAEPDQRLGGERRRRGRRLGHGGRAIRALAQPATERGLHGLRPRYGPRPPSARPALGVGGHRFPPTDPRVRLLLLGWAVRWHAHRDGRDDDGSARRLGPGARRAVGAVRAPAARRSCRRRRHDEPLRRARCVRPAAPGTGARARRGLDARARGAATRRCVAGRPAVRRTAALVRRAARGGRGQAARQSRRDLHVYAVELPPGGADADPGQRADGRRDDRLTVCAGVGPVEPLEWAVDLRAWPLARARGAHRPRVPG